MTPDILITDGIVYDGISPEPMLVDIAIKNQRIVAIGKNLPKSGAKKVIQAKGMLVSPGFIDSHASEGYSYLLKEPLKHKLYQGITTEIIGNCGYSPAPVFSGIENEIHDLSKKIGFNFNWQDLQEYFSRISASGGTAINVGSFIGHNTLRGGLVENPLEITPSELEIMQSKLAHGIQQGALGLSSGLIYTPGCYCDINELVQLAKTVADFGGLYSSHIRNERDKLEDAVEEALYIGKTANIPVLISHLKAAERKNWGKVPKVIDLIDNFRYKNQHNVSFDVYPYSAVSTRLNAFIPKQLLAQGSKVLRTSLLRSENRQKIAEYLTQRGLDLSQMTPLIPNAAQGKLMSITEMAKQCAVAPYEQVCNLLQENPETWIIYECLAESDVDAAVLWPDSMICSDSWSYPVNAATDIGDPHPRTYGAFSHYLDKYCFSSERLSYGEAIRKITSVPAQFLGLTQRGSLKEGNFADIVIINPNTFSDNASYTQPRQYSEGVEFLLINGTFAIEHQEIINYSAGTVLRHERTK